MNRAKGYSATVECPKPKCTGQAYTNGYCSVCGTFVPCGKGSPAGVALRTVPVDEYMASRYDQRLREGFGNEGVK